jgi:hypothetical protein
MSKIQSVTRRILKLFQDKCSIGSIDRISRVTRADISYQVPVFHSLICASATVLGLLNAQRKMLELTLIIVRSFSLLLAVP